jgi:hypothetical protein
MPLALTVLCQEGPMARSYLGVLHAAGYRVERIVLMVQKRDPVHRRPWAPWLPTFLRQPLARTMQDLRMNHWPREFLRSHALLCKPWLDSLGQAYGFDPAVYRCVTESPGYGRYADHVDEVFIDGLADPALERHLRGLPGRRTILFTGGGMVPSSLLNIQQQRFIHVHPGVLPSVRGADGLLWSVLLRGRPGATAFYMAPGLDTGDIIIASDFDIPPMPAEFLTLDVDMAYRLLYAFVDPMLRALLLLRIVAQSNGDLYSLPTVTQREDEGTTFHFMNARTRRFAFDRLAFLAAARLADPVVEEV